MTDKDFEYRNDEKWIDATYGWLGAKKDLEWAIEREKRLREDILDMCNSNSFGNGVRCQKINRKGSIDYEKIPLLQGLDLEPYRKESSEYWKICLEE
jgi:hypothetical protein